MCVLRSVSKCEARFAGLDDLPSCTCTGTVAIAGRAPSIEVLSAVGAWSALVAAHAPPLWNVSAAFTELSAWADARMGELLDRPDGEPVRRVLDSPRVLTALSIYSIVVEVGFPLAMLLPSGLPMLLACVTFHLGSPRAGWNSRPWLNGSSSYTGPREQCKSKWNLNSFPEEFHKSQ